jgi:heme/copper-type cytochrome/quinol oxidase subunit 3
MNPWSPPERQGFSLPELGTWLFIASLAMLFGSFMVGYLRIRLQDPPFGTELPELGTIQLPPALWGSTLILIASAVVLHLASKAARLGESKAYRQRLYAAFGLSILFVIIQTPCMLDLLAEHKNEQTGAHVTFSGLYGLVFTMILLHALHVIGGLLFIVGLAWWATRTRQKAIHPVAVKMCAMYWHFLDAVWIIMFATLVALG